MQRKDLYQLLGLSLILVLSGCVVRTYPVTRDRIDQDLTTGNRGYIQGQVPQGAEKERKSTRNIQIVEVELRSPLKFEKTPKTTPQEVTPKEITESQMQAGNRGYISQAAAPEILGSQSGASFEKYTVQKGDTLQKISKKFYGTTKGWLKIYNANKDTLSGPNKVYPRQVLNIPQEQLKETKENLK